QIDARFDHRVHHLNRRLETRVAEHDVGHQQNGLLFALLANVGFQAHEFFAAHFPAPFARYSSAFWMMNCSHLESPIASAMVKMSLSPRPDWLIRITSLLFIRGASANAWAKACEDSSAGIRP